MTIGVGLSIFGENKPSFLWSASKEEVDINGMSCTVEDIDSISGNEPFSIWDPANERFQIVYPDTDKKLGSVGDFSDGKLSQYFSSLWTDSNLGFSPISPTTSGVIGQISEQPDILDDTFSVDVTYIDTDEAQDSVFEKLNSRSATYDRLFQLLVYNEDGYSAAGNVEIGFNETVGTRTTDSFTWVRDLPGSRGWSAVMNLCPNGATSIYITVRFKQNTGRWKIAAPFFYNQFSTFENIVRAPIPKVNGTTYERGQYQVYTDESLQIPISGWMAMSLVLPDRSTSNGHLDYSGSSEYGFAGLMSWESGNYRVRTIFSDSGNKLGVQLDNNGTSFAFMFGLDDWDDFEKIGLCVTWGISSGKEYATLYINGKKINSVFDTIDWFPSNLTSSKIYIGANGDGGAAADCWINKLAIGRRPLHRCKARELSVKMLDFVRR